MMRTLRLGGLVAVLALLPVAMGHTQPEADHLEQGLLLERLALLEVDPEQRERLIARAIAAYGRVPETAISIQKWFESLQARVRIARLDPTTAATWSALLDHIDEFQFEYDGTVAAFESFRLKGELFHLLGNRRGAEGEFRGLMFMGVDIDEFDPELVRTLRSLKLKGTLGYARLLLDAGELEKAAAVLRLCGEKFPDDPSPPRVQLDCRELRDQLRRLRVIAKKNPGRSSADRWIASGQQNESRALATGSVIALQAAARDWRTSLSMLQQTTAPDDARNLVARARCRLALARLGRDRSLHTLAARRLLQRVLDVEGLPGSSGQLRDKARTLLGN